MIKNKLSLFAICLGPAVLLAQPPHHPGPGGPPTGDPGMLHFARDMKVVKGQPYSAELMNESVQVLGDGTKISSKTSGSVYRDTDGRTRRDESAAQGLKSTTIFDPVASVSLTLNSTTKTVSKQTLRTPPNHLGPAHTVSAERANRQNSRENRQNHTVEDLGNQAIEGVQAQGRRTTKTIPAGTMGNDRDIKVIDEVWFSPELQVVVQSHHVDPWTGDVTYKLSNIRRGDQPHAMFEAPADYQMKEQRGFRREGPPPPARQN